MQGRVQVKPFKWEHWGALWELRAHQLAENGILLPDLPGEGEGPDLSSPYEKDYHRIDSVYLSGAGSFWIAWLEDTPIGCVGAQDLGKVPGRGRGVELRRMYVREAYRRRGVGTCLVQALIDHCAAHGVGAVELWTAENGPGRHLYARLGFRVVPGPGPEFQDLPEWRDQMRMRLGSLQGAGSTDSTENTANTGSIEGRSVASVVEDEPNVGRLS
jgi:GNAT superfamily N-acetyltransferase